MKYAEGKFTGMLRALRCFRSTAAVGAVCMALFFDPAAVAQGVSAVQDRDDGYGAAATLRDYIGQQVGEIQKLVVPRDNASIPVQPGPATQPDRYQTTEAKRYLGKLLFHDPVRTARVNINQGQPKDLPTGTSFGGTMGATDPRITTLFPGTSVSTTKVQRIVDAQLETGSCGSCHIGEAAGKAGQQLNFNTGGEGRGYTDERGNFVPRRRPQSILAKLRDTRIFAGDALVDTLPTLTDIWVDDGNARVTTPAYFYHYPNPPGLLNPDAASMDPKLQLLATGRLDQLDSVARMSPSMVGFAFNNRLLLGGFAGEPQSTPGSLNPFSDPAQENLTLLLLDAHRMIGKQADAILSDANPGKAAFVKLFRDAFPTEAAEAVATNDVTKLVNDVTVLRATSTFLRTVVTRNTPFDKFLAGSNRALTEPQQRGARLFFTKASAGGAGCFSCHSGPMLNKQPGDPDVAGIGNYVEQNFFNIGIGDHPIQALNALARGKLDATKLGSDGFPYHAQDTGRQEITGNADDAFKFRVLTLRQLKDGRNFFHDGSFTRVRDVVEYFNAGVPQDPTAGAAASLSSRFTHPRGPGTPRGLGLSKGQVDDLTDFLENALYDPALVNYDPNSSTDTLQPNVRDLTYSKYHPELFALGAKDGFMLSGKAIDENDPLARRDEGLDPPIDVTSQAAITLIESDKEGAGQSDAYRITNSSNSIIDTHLLLIAQGLPSGVRLSGRHAGITSTGKPYLRVFLKDGVLLPGESMVATLRFKLPAGTAPLRYRLDLLSGQGNP